MKKFLVSLVLMTAGLEAIAHPGHEAIDSHLLHYLLSPDHAFLIVLLAVGITAFALRKRLAVVFRRVK